MFHQPHQPDIVRQIENIPIAVTLGGCKFVFNEQLRDMLGAYYGRDCGDCDDNKSEGSVASTVIADQGYGEFKEEDKYMNAQPVYCAVEDCITRCRELPAAPSTCPKGQGPKGQGDDATDQLCRILTAKFVACLGLFKKCINYGAKCCPTFEQCCAQECSLFLFRKFVICFYNLCRTHCLESTCKVIMIELDAINAIAWNFYLAGKINFETVSVAIDTYQAKSDDKGIETLLLRLPKCFDQLNVFAPGWTEIFNKLWGLAPYNQLAFVIETLIIARIKKAAKLSYQHTQFVRPIALYHHCLSVFLLENISKGFIFKKLYLINQQSLTSYKTGCCDLDLLCSLTEKEYSTILGVESKLIYDSKCEYDEEQEQDQDI